MRQYIFAILIIIAFSPLIVIACGCAPSCSLGPNPQTCVNERKKESAAVFSGKVLALVENEDETVKATFSVTRSWKGIRSKQIDVYYYHGRGSSCLFSLSKDREYTYFAWKSKGKYFVGVCSFGDGLEKYLGKPLKLRN